MKARLIRDKENNFMILCNNGTIANADVTNLKKLLMSFRQAEDFTGEDGACCWNKEYPDMSMYPGNECAMVTDAFQLVISDFTPFMDVFCEEKTNLISCADYAKLHGKSIEQIKLHCRNGQIQGAVKIAHAWVIPKDAPYPSSKNWRKPDPTNK